MLLLFVLKFIIAITVSSSQFIGPFSNCYDFIKHNGQRFLERQGTQFVVSNKIVKSRIWESREDFSNDGLILIMQLGVIWCDINSTNDRGNWFQIFLHFFLHCKIIMFVEKIFAII